MKKVLIYKYLGTNGVIESPVHLEDIYYVRMYRLTADDDKNLTNGEVQYRQVLVPEEELEEWYEIPKDKNN